MHFFWNEIILNENLILSQFERDINHCKVLEVSCKNQTPRIHTLCLQLTTTEVLRRVLAALDEALNRNTLLAAKAANSSQF